MGELKKVWTNTAKEQLKAIYENYKVKFLQGAKAIKDEMLPATIIKTKQLFNELLFSFILYYFYKK